MIYITAAFLLILGLAVYLHIRSNKSLSAQWQKHFDAKTAKWLDQFAWSRSLQLIAAICSGLLAVLLLDHMHLQSQNETMLAIHKAMDQRLEQLVQIQHKVDALTQEVNANHNASMRQPALRQADVSVSAQAVPATPERPAPTDARFDDSLQPSESISDAATIEDVYNPEEYATDKQSEMDAIKKRYEGLLVNYLFLKKCNLINPQDYHAIISTLAREMASVNAPGRMEHDIITAAQGSYREIYANSDCSGPETAQLKTQYDDYIKTIASNLPPLR